MTAKWKEVSAYTGLAIDEDAPTNFGGEGSGVDMNPTGMIKKKKTPDPNRINNIKQN